MVLFTLEERLRLIKSPSVNSHFPISFENGPTWDRMNGICSGCGKALEDEFFSGTVDQPFKGVYTIRAVGCCQECQTGTCFHWNLKADALTGIDRNGNYSVWKVRKRTRLERWIYKLKKFLKII